MIKYEDTCNGCSDCIHCGRDKKQKFVYCDFCGDLIPEYKNYFLYKGEKESCASCVRETIFWEFDNDEEKIKRYFAEQGEYFEDEDISTDLLENENLTDLADFLGLDFCEVI